MRVRYLGGFTLCPFYIKPAAFMRWSKETKMITSLLAFVGTVAICVVFVIAVSEIKDWVDK